ncbi:hypothetical protein Lepto782_19625 [Leptospira interrogans serovar Canicola]|uniref:MORN repeat protein n=1 Tax=Leptospira interrogans serovar Canicola TaxID=211880 RepID=A0AAP9WHW3_LEPIR|nr:hypothetical protein Lepto782_19625 [Leptospira interrogans serovar Canicola]
MYACENGESFEGIYSNDLANANGRLVYPDRTILEGKFKNGILIRSQKLPPHRDEKSSDKE